MTCQAAQELILESLDCRIDEEQQTNLESHIAQCEICRCFQEAQLVLDGALAEHYVAPQLSAAFKAKLARKISAEKRHALQEWIPDVLHLGGGIVATVACFLWLPVSPAAVLTVGVALTFVSYVVQTIFRFWLEDLEGL
ncbi:MAG: anti-sigma factor family protein [Terriglobia bacterium]